MDNSKKVVKESKQKNVEKMHNTSMMNENKPNCVLIKDGRTVSGNPMNCVCPTMNSDANAKTNKYGPTMALDSNGNASYIC